MSSKVQQNHPKELKTTRTSPCGHTHHSQGPCGRRAGGPRSHAVTRGHTATGRGYTRSHSGQATVTHSGRDAVVSGAERMRLGATGHKGLRGATRSRAASEQAHPRRRRKVGEQGPGAGRLPAGARVLWMRTAWGCTPSHGARRRSLSAADSTLSGFRLQRKKPHGTCTNSVLSSRPDRLPAVGPRRLEPRRLEPRRSGPRRPVLLSLASRGCSSLSRAVLFLIWRLSHLKYFGISSNIFCFRKRVKIN